MERYQINVSKWKRRTPVAETWPADVDSAVETRPVMAGGLASTDSHSQFAC